MTATTEEIENGWDNAERAGAPYFQCVSSI